MGEENETHEWSFNEIIWLHSISSKDKANDLITNSITKH